MFFFFWSIHPSNYGLIKARLGKKTLLLAKTKEPLESSKQKSLIKLNKKGIALIPTRMGVLLKMEEFPWFFVLCFFLWRWECVHETSLGMFWKWQLLWRAGGYKVTVVPGADFLRKKRRRSYLKNGCHLQRLGWTCFKSSIKKREWDFEWNYYITL